MMPGAVSLIVLTVDRFDFLRRCVESVHRNTRSPYEWVFVLNGASAEVAAYVYGLSTPHACEATTIVRLETDTGVTPGRNAGIEASHGEFLLFLDDDAWVSEDRVYLDPEDLPFDWLHRMTRWFHRDLRLGVTGQTGSYINLDSPGVFWACNVRGAKCDVIQGYCMMFSRAVVDMAGRLDPFYDRFWHEESDYCLAAKAVGFTVRRLGYVGVTHNGAGSGDDGSYGSKIAYMFKKWRDAFPNILEPRATWNTTS